MPKPGVNVRQSTGVAQARPQPHGQRLVSALVALALALASLDQTAPGTALPAILTDLHDLDSVTWVLSSYLLASTITIPTAIFCSRRIRYRPALVAGMAIFMAGSLLAGAAPTMQWVILFRGLQGLGAGWLIALIFLVFESLFPPTVRARWQAVFAGLFALASVAGPTVALWLLGFASWRWLFYLNLPLMLVALILLLRGLPSSTGLHGREYTP